MGLLLGSLAEDRHEPSACDRDDFLRVAPSGHVALDLVGRQPTIFKCSTRNPLNWTRGSRPQRGQGALEAGGLESRGIAPHAGPAHALSRGPSAHPRGHPVPGRGGRPPIDAGPLDRSRDAGHQRPGSRPPRLSLLRAPSCSEGTKIPAKSECWDVSPRTAPIGTSESFRLLRFTIPIAPYISDHLRWPECWFQEHSQPEGTPH